MNQHDAILVIATMSIVFLVFIIACIWDASKWKRIDRQRKEKDYLQQHYESISQPSDYREREWLG